MRVVVPPAMRPLYESWRMAPGVIDGGRLVMTGFSGVALDGSMSPDPETQMRTAFDQVGLVLAEASCIWADLIEMTSYHVDIAAQIDLFRRVRNEYVAPPYPAWTALGVAGLASAGAVVEIRAVARVRSPS
ncbi:RidA family protein [Pontivivens ytuae]|uniref:RidA family protein n=1 Tax=Pontivivens ytuae TaxID=2789856 RepID=A0A7S9LR73_9RHOB|nr:RidA family protein [Pontivivens ytuae]QPH53789.1 RidA family protein [Pontivivens ytuae]